jgi:uncharacterized protein YbbC (DUF1343 family)
VSLYGDDERSLLPRREAFAGLDLLLIDLQDIGTRYYTTPRRRSGGGGARRRL